MAVSSAYSVFQPVFSVLHRRVVGHEALMRRLDADGEQVPPLAAFGAAGADDAFALDVACHRLHLSGAAAVMRDSEWLFLNVRPETLAVDAYPRILAATAREYALSPEQVVLEVLESTADPRVLGAAIDMFRDEGFVIALDDFGAGQSNIDRIAHLAPDIVKIDRSLLVQATRSARIERMLPNLIALLHEAECLVIVEGVETQRELDHAAEWNADMVQGFFLGVPDTERADAAHGALAIGASHDALGYRRAQRLQEHRNLLERYERALLHSAMLLRQGQPLAQASAELMAMSRAARCFLLDGDGHPIGETIDGAAAQLGRDARRFAPVTNVAGARWNMRPYFIEAMQRPYQVITTQPYLSIIGAHGCVTLTVSLPLGGALVVFGVDVHWDW